MPSTGRPSVYAELKKMVIEEVKRQGKPHGLHFDQASSDYTTTARRGLQAFTVIPLIVYRVYPDRLDELIRGVDTVGAPLASFGKVLATSDENEGAEIDRQAAVSLTNGPGQPDGSCSYSPAQWNAQTS